MPEFEKAATILKNKKVNCKLAKIDATENKNIAGTFGIEGYPTLK
jgi:thioredoxin-like negative regulator of GroEL